MKLKDLVTKDKKRGGDIVLNLRLRKKTQSNPDKEKQPDHKDGCDPDMSSEIHDEEGISAFM